MDVSASLVFVLFGFLLKFTAGQARGDTDCSDSDQCCVSTPAWVYMERSGSMVTLQWERPYKFDNEPCKVTRYNVHYYCDRTGGQQTENKYQPFSVDSTKIFHYANVNVDTDQQCYFAVRVEAILGCSQTCNQESRVTFGVPLDINSEDVQVEMNTRCLPFNHSEPITQGINIKVSETDNLVTITNICDPRLCTEMVHCCQHQYIDYTNDSICIKPSLSYADVIVYRIDEALFEHFNKRLLYNMTTPPPNHERETVVRICMTVYFEIVVALFALLYY